MIQTRSIPDLKGVLENGMNGAYGCTVYLWAYTYGFGISVLYDLVTKMVDPRLDKALDIVHMGSLII